jgi:para-nitrobenzyl esterase
MKFAHKQNMTLKKTLLCSLIALTIAACGHNPKPSSEARIDTPQGPVQGISTETDGIYTFNGLPFASPPVGELRWAAPQPPVRWTETRLAEAFGNRCMQPTGTEDGFMNRLIEGQGLSGFKTWMIKRVIASAKPAPVSEDCLYLNVRTGNLNSNEKQPVLVWIHGGGHQFGSADTSFYQANGLVEKDVVLVTINYRLGAFGYMAHPALSADDPNGVSGNYGTLDQMAALRWVQENISAYGGDPNNVTIFGESAGAWSVTELMSSPLAKGLFHKAIAQSGSSTYHLGQKQGDGVGWPSGYSMGIRVAESLGLENPTAEELRAVPAEEILAKLPEKADEAFHHIRDSYVFPENVGLAFQTGEFNAVPFLTGFNADEATLFFPDDPEPSVWLEGLPSDAPDKQFEMLERAYPGQGERLQTLYDLTENFVEGGTQMMGDEIFGVNIRFAAEKNEAQNKPTYTYHFTRVPPSDKQTLGAYHAAEIPFVFDSAEAALGNSDQDEQLADLMGTYWTNFAKTGNPNEPIAVPTNWEAYKGQNWMIFSANTGAPITEATTDIRKEKLDALEVGLITKLEKLEATHRQNEQSIGAHD